MAAYPVADWRIIDVVDFTDTDLVRAEVVDLEQSGVEPLLIMRGLGNQTIPFLVDAIIREVKAPRRIKLLRIHGHGAPGCQSIAAGLDIYLDGDDGLTYRNVDRFAPVLQRLATFFTPDGKAWLMGCETGKGEEGKALLSGLARAWGVPVTAGVLKQSPGGISTFQHIGPTVTQYPKW